MISSGKSGRFSGEISEGIPVENSEVVTGRNPAGLYGSTPVDTFGEIPGGSHRISE